MVATLWPDLISASAICMATVDLPDPPFSLPTTMTRAGRASVAFSLEHEVRPPKSWVTYRDRRLIFLVRTTSSDSSRFSRQPEISGAAIFSVKSSIGTSRQVTSRNRRLHRHRGRAKPRRPRVGDARAIASARYSVKNIARGSLYFVSHSSQKTSVGRKASSTSDQAAPFRRNRTPTKSLSCSGSKSLAKSVRR